MKELKIKEDEINILKKDKQYLENDKITLTGDLNDNINLIFEREAQIENLKGNNINLNNII